MNQYGFIPDEITPDNYVLGAGMLPQIILQPDGQWDEFLPSVEIQYKNGVETMACASYGTNNCIEVLGKRLFGKEWNWSDRFTAKTSGTTPAGNSPHTVVETIRKVGLVEESEWAFRDDIKTFEEYYAEPPKDLFIKAALFLAGFKVWHEWVFTKGTVEDKQKKLIEALRYSPIGISVQAWSKDDEGFYIKKGDDNHWVMLYGYEEGKYWKIFDHYDATHKRLVWDYDFGFAKRYHIEKLEIKPYFSFWDKVKRFIKWWINDVFA